MRVTSTVITLLLLVSTPPATADEHPCRYASPDDPAFRLLLQSVKLSESGSFTGVFELLNREVQPAITLPVTKNGKTAVLGLRYAGVEFQDLNGTWQPLASVPGDFRDTADYLTIRPGETAKFSVFLMTKETADRSASDFRVLIRLSNPRLCLTSAKFRATPLRQTVKSFTTDPH